MSDVQKTTLDNGLTILTEQVPDAGTVALGTWCATGTRHEDPANNGVAHMVEHMLFKGTQKRNAFQIAEDIENVGGRMNAYTGREMTAYFIHLLGQDKDLAMDVIADMVQHSTMPDDEIERERGVIIQEIGMYADTPDEKVFDMFQDAAFKNQILGAPILGEVKNIENMTKGAMKTYIDTHYTPSRMICVASGNVSHDWHVNQIEKHYQFLAKDKTRTDENSTYSAQDARENKALEQAHIVMGFEAIDYNHENYSDLRVANSILGSGMSSRLFQEIREKRGLVYSIYSFIQSYRDTGIFGIYAGTGGHQISELMPTMVETLKSASTSLTKDELTRAKAQLKASLLMSRESMFRRADMLAKSWIHNGEVLDINDRIEKIDRVTIKGVQQILDQILSSPPTLAALGPIDQLEDHTVYSDRLAA